MEDETGLVERQNNKAAQILHYESEKQRANQKHAMSVHVASAPHGRHLSGTFRPGSGDPPATGILLTPSNCHEVEELCKKRKCDPQKSRSDATAARGEKRLQSEGVKSCSHIDHMRKSLFISHLHKLGSLLPPESVGVKSSPGDVTKGTSTSHSLVIVTSSDRNNYLVLVPFQTCGRSD